MTMIYDLVLVPSCYKMLRAYVEPDGMDWEQHLSACEFAYNNAQQSNIELAPFEVLLGRRPRVPLDSTILPSTAAHGHNAAPSGFIFGVSGSEARQAATCSMSALLAIWRANGDSEISDTYREITHGQAGTHAKQGCAGATYLVERVRTPAMLADSGPTGPWQAYPQMERAC